jgi:hypothetical protein
LPRPSTRTTSRSRWGVVISGLSACGCTVSTAGRPIGSRARGHEEGQRLSETAADGPTPRRDWSSRRGRPGGPPAQRARLPPRHDPRHGRRAGPRRRCATGGPTWQFGTSSSIRGDGGREGRVLLAPACT